MKFVIQRVTEASVTINGQVTGSIGRGFMVLIGVGKEDTREEADRLIKKMIGLRIFADENGKTNLSLKDVGGSLLLVSQFTLYANCSKGNRPSFVDAGDPARQRNCTITLFPGAVSRFRTYRRESSERKCRCVSATTGLLPLFWRDKDVSV